MDYKIVVDSCCDLTPEYRKQLDAKTVPLHVTLGDESIIDDDSLHVPSLLEGMKRFAGKIGSSAPSPELYQKAFQGPQTSFAITLSSNLSSSYSSAMLGKAMAEEEHAETDVHVFDSKSASAGQVLLALKIRRMIDDKIHKSEIVSTIESFIQEMKTYFVLDNLDNLVKNGRLHKITGKLISVLHMKPIMGSDGDGNIVLFGNARGEKQVIRKLTDTIEQSGRKTDGESMVITHCNNPGLAEKLMDAIKSRYHFRDIVIMPTNGISSVYANDKGIIMAF